MPALAEKIARKCAAVGTARAARICAFRAVRDLPYGYPEEEGPEEELLARGGIDCRVKALLLSDAFRALGYRTRPVLMRYRMLEYPEEARFLPERIDYHHACEIQIQSSWVLTDATYDPPLAAAGFQVNDWDGLTPTLPGVRPLAVRVGEDECPAFEAEFRRFAEALSDACRRHPREIKAYARRFNEMLARVRTGDRDTLVQIALRR